MLAASLAVAAAPALPFPARSQAWPTKPVRLVVPFGPGGPADVFARQIGQELAESLKQQFVIDNRPGAGAVVGTDIVAKAAPDGYTLLMMSNAHTTNETLLANRPYVLMRDLAPVAPVNSSDLVIVVDPKLKAATLQEFIALAKAEPGKLAYASSGPGTPYHMAGELFKAMSGTDILHVPHKNSADARNAVIGGHVQMMIDAVTAMKGHVDAGQVRALATTGLARSAVLPGVPTANEAGVPGYEATIWLGVMAPAGTPADIVEKLNAEIGRIIARPALREAWAKQGAVPMTMTPAQFATYMKGDIDKWAKVIQQAGIKAQ
ncbi:MAG: tripartite tricarboxylate transporter substrate binding protein [Proteobacteria bacterium]|nr:tripartite tricarboxylate transporter substrate binding protein [Pseudomonadota bacterium]